MRRPPIEIMGEVVRDTRAEEAAPMVADAYRSGGFARFHFTSIEISSTAGGTHVRSRSTRFENGRLTSAFEGDVGPNVFAEAAMEAQRAMLRSTAALFGAFFGLLPGARQRRE